MKNYYQIFLFLTLCFIIFSAKPVFAAQLFFEPKNLKITQGEEFLLDVFFNPEGDAINALEGEIIFPDDKIELKEIRDGNSDVNFWVERPWLKRAGAVIFSGIIPGGFQETKGFLFSVVFQAKMNGEGVVSINDVKVLLSDGEGTEAYTKILPFNFFVLEKGQVGQSVVPILKDKDIPEKFNIEIGKDPDVFDGKWFVAFATQDKGSGIDHYEVCEGSERNCVIAESPCVLKDQKLRSNIYVRAIDGEGNDRLEMLSPQNPLKWYEIWWIWFIIILIVIFFIFIWKKFIKSY